MGWGVRLAGAVLAAWAAVPACAQTDYGVLTEAQKRRVHLPYVRAATDCIARGIQYNIDPLRLARAGRWGDALGAIPKGYCSNEIAGLINSHDQLYGYGTGKTFFGGPYIEDLPRALGNRLRSEFERLAAAEVQAEAVRRQEIARQEADRKARIDEAERAFVLLRDRMYACTTKQVLDLVGSAESAEVIATAALTVCRAEVERTLQAGQAKMRLEDPGPVSQAVMDEAERVVRRNVVTTTVQAKAALNVPKPAPAPPPVIAAAIPAAPPSPATSPAATNVTPIGECLRTIAKAREGKFVNRDDLLKAMLELCRPEIEAAARTAYLKDDKSTLEKQRERVLGEAMREAKGLLGS